MQMSDSLKDSLGRVKTSRTLRRNDTVMAIDANLVRAAKRGRVGLTTPPRANATMGASPPTTAPTVADPTGHVEVATDE